jgi:hypothetical protein
MYIQQCIVWYSNIRTGVTASTAYSTTVQECNTEYISTNVHTQQRMWCQHTASSDYQLQQVLLLVSVTVTEKWCK